MAEELSAEAMLAEVNKDQATTSPEAAKPESTAPTEQVKTAVDPATGQLYKYTTSGGKEVSESLDMVLKRAGMGYHYAQQMHNLNQQTERFKAIEERNKALSRWEEYDKYAQGNPQWAKHVQESWDSRGNLQQQNQQQVDPYADKFKTMEERLSDLQKFKDEALQVRTKEQYEAQDKTFGEEIKTVAKNYQVDLDQSDEQGRSLEWQVLDHMEKMGLDGSRPGQFTAAFKDFYFDNLVGRSKEQEKVDQTKSKVELKKAGILDISRTPKTKTSDGGHRPGMSWNEARDAVLAELQAAKG